MLVFIVRLREIFEHRNTTPQQSLVNDIALPFHVDLVEDGGIEYMEYLKRRAKVVEGRTQDMISEQANGSGEDGGDMGLLGVTAIEIHENIGNHIHARIVTLPKGTNRFQELLAHGSTLDGAGTGNIIEGDAHEILGDEGENRRAYVFSEPTLLKLFDPLVELKSSLLEDNLVGVSVELLEGQLAGVSVVDIAEGISKLFPAFLEVIRVCGTRHGLYKDSRKLATESQREGERERESQGEQLSVCVSLCVCECVHDIPFAGGEYVRHGHLPDL